MARGNCCLWIGIGALSLIGVFGYSWLLDHYPRYHALMDAIEKTDVERVRRLLANGANPNDYPLPSYNEDDQSPINFAAQEGNTQIVGLLLDKGADIETTDPWGGPPMALAARNDDVQMIAYLISRGARVNDLGKDGSSALYGAAVEGKPKALIYLLGVGANPNTNIGDLNALDSARALKEPETARILEQAGAK